MPKKTVQSEGLTDTWGRNNRKLADKNCEACSKQYRPRTSTSRFLDHWQGLEQNLDVDVLGLASGPRTADKIVRRKAGGLTLEVTSRGESGLMSKHRST